VLIFDNGIVGAPDGKADIVFRFAPVHLSEKTQNLYFDLWNANLVFDERRVWVKDESGSLRVLLTLEMTENTAILLADSRASERDQIPMVYSTQGYALQRQTVYEGEVDLERPVLRQPQLALDDEDEGPSCLAGGRGSTECSYSCSSTSCSVSCGSGTHSCCGCTNSLATCVCVPN
jgi:hypothetical protein